jgi:Ca2+-transporting ATPase
MITNFDLLVGDVILLDQGDKIVADCIMFESHGLIIDEASLTGESDPIKKTLDKDPWIRSGTQVNGKRIIFCRSSPVIIL